MTNILESRQNEPLQVGRGFTLIELLVVISIIALLIAILLPSLAKARDSARKIKCGTQARTINFAIQLYGQDHKGWFPIIFRDRGNMFHNGNSGNPATIRNYFGNDALSSSSAPAGTLSVALCPSRDEAIPDQYTGYGGRYLGTTYHIVAGVGTLGYSHWGDPTHAYTDNSYSPDGNQAWYGWIKNVGGAYGGSKGTPVPRESLIGNTHLRLAPSDQPMVGDVFNNTDTAPIINLYPSVGSSTWGGGNYRHNHMDGLNVAFADGHVSWRNKDSLSKFVQFYSSAATTRLWW